MDVGYSEAYFPRVLRGDGGGPKTGTQSAPGTYADQQGIMRELWHPKPLRWWIPVSLVLVAVAAYAVFVVIGYLERQGASSLGFINVVGLMLVVLGVVAAGAILRRASPPT